MGDALETGFALDRQWHWLRGEMDDSKKPALVQVVRVLTDARIPYAVIGGIALQVHQAEPRTTLDIDIAVTDCGLIPRAALAASGFVETGRHAHSENWSGAGGTPVQFTDDPELRTAVLDADTIALDELSLRVIRRIDLLHAKLRAASDGARRRSKRIQDLADANALVEQNPALRQDLTADEIAVLDRAIV